jgi:MFS transporter, OFA family, oxalate/formate antiporter
MFKLYYTRSAPTEKLELLAIRKMVGGPRARKLRASGAAQWPMRDCAGSHVGVPHVSHGGGAVKSRWVVAIAGMLVMASLGSIYSWSIFTQPLIAGFGWSNKTVTWAFALATFFLSLGAVAGGRLLDRLGPRAVTLIGVALWGLGWISAGLGTPHYGLSWLYLMVGVIGGFGVGMAYVTPVAVVTKWFPDRRGLGGGVVVMGFALGACFFNLVVKSIPNFDAAALAASEHAADVQLGTLAPHHVQAIMDVFVGSGIVFILLGGICACFLRNPPVKSESEASIEVQNVSYTTREMLWTPQFYVLWSMLFLNVTAGILVIANAIPIMHELTGSPPRTLATAFGAVALANVIGRFFWGAVSDYIGRNLAFVAIFGIQAVVFFMLSGTTSLAAVMLGYAIILLCYGGGFGTMPSFCADYFGTRHLGANYGMLLTAWGIAGLAGPLFAAHVKDTTGSFSGALPVVSVMLLAATALPLFAKQPRLRRSTVLDFGPTESGRAIVQQT